MSVLRALQWPVRIRVSPAQEPGRLVLKNASKAAIFGQNAHHGAPLLPQLDQSHDVAIPYVGSTAQLLNAGDVLGVNLGDYDVCGRVTHLTNKINY